VDGIWGTFCFVALLHYVTCGDPHLLSSLSVFYMVSYLLPFDSPSHLLLTTSFPSLLGQFAAIISQLLWHISHSLFTVVYFEAHLV
ncbi:hypothetical protein EV401DRAFT_2021009, partial [Pisolithus croceorrhizus]